MAVRTETIEFGEENTDRVGRFRIRLEERDPRRICGAAVPGRRPRSRSKGPVADEHLRHYRTNIVPSRSTSAPRPSGRIRVNSLKPAPSPGIFAKMPCGPRNIRPLATS